jgi:hypothetical protein
MHGCASHTNGPRAWATVPHGLLQPVVFGVGLLEDGDVRVGVFPGGEEILISGAGVSGVFL